MKSICRPSVRSLDVPSRNQAWKYQVEPGLMTLPLVVGEGRSTARVYAPLEPEFMGGPRRVVAELTETQRVPLPRGTLAVPLP